MAFTSAKVASVSKSVARTARRSVSCQAQQANREQKIVQRRQLFSLLAGTLGVAALGGKAEALPTVSLFLSFFFFCVCVCVCERERERERVREREREKIDAYECRPPLFNNPVNV